jgi:N-acyl-D-aspartate/D-glutamate deacylase
MMTPMAFDILIKNGLLIDGTGNPWFKADVGISNGKIAEIDGLIDAKAERVLDVS